MSCIRRPLSDSMMWPRQREPAPATNGPYITSFKNDVRQTTCAMITPSATPSPDPHTDSIPVSEENTNIVRINPVISCFSLNVSWNFSKPLHECARRGHPLYEHLERYPATDPPKNVFYAVSHQLNTTLAIGPAEGSEFVSVFDVLCGVHEFLHTKADPEQAGTKDHTEAMVEFFWRCEDIEDPNTSYQELQMGVKLVDYLKGEHCFSGFLQGELSNRWDLCLRLGEVVRVQDDGDDKELYNECHDDGESPKYYISDDDLAFLTE